MEDFNRLNKDRIKSLFAIRSFRHEYSNFINDLLRKLYQNEGHWGKILGDGNYGVINTNYDLTKAPMNDYVREFFTKVHNNKDPKWSLLNYVNTHWSSFAEIADSLNYFITKGYIKNEKELLNFDNNYFETLDNMKYLLTKTGRFIFLPQDNLTIFYRIMGTIATSNFYGNKAECITLESLTNLGEITDVIKSKPSQKIDTHQGIDIRFKLNGIYKTLQCKSFKDLEFVDGFYIFRNISNPGWYNVDYFSFVNSSDKILYIFDTKKGGLRYKENKGSYIFDEDLLKFKMKI